MVKKNKKTELFGLNLLPEQNEKEKYTPQHFINKAEIDKKIKNIKISTEPINKQIPNSFWKDYF